MRLMCIHRLECERLSFSARLASENAGLARLKTSALGAFLGAWRGLLGAGNISLCASMPSGLAGLKMRLAREL